MHGKWCVVCGTCVSDCVCPSLGCVGCQTGCWESLHPEQVAGTPALIKELDCLTATTEDIAKIEADFRSIIHTGQQRVTAFAGWFDVHFKVQPRPHCPLSPWPHCPHPSLVELPSLPRPFISHPSTAVPPSASAGADEGDRIPTAPGTALPCMWGPILL